MTQKDKWAKRPVVIRYREFKDLLRMEVRQAMIQSGHTGIACAQMLSEADQVSWKAFLPIPKSRTKKKKAELSGAPHRQKPDRDNIDKAILDALFSEDAGIYGGNLEKRWDDGEGPRIELQINIP